MATERGTVVITGSSGLIGAATANRLHTTYDVVGFDRPGVPHPPAHIECIDFDVTSDESVRNGLRQVRERHGNRIASVIHLAAYYDFSGAPSEKYEEITVRGTERLLRELRGFDVGQFVFSSTMLVHAPSEPGQKITEDWPIDPKWAYPQSKVWAENVIRAERDDIPVIMLRMAGVYDDMCHSIPIAHQIQRIYERTFTSHVYPADPKRGQAFVHLDDLVDVFPRLIKRRTELPPETVLLIGEPGTVGYGELQETLGRLIHGEEWSTYRVPKVVAKVGAWVQDHLPFGPEPFIKPWMIDRADDHYELDITRARTLLGWEPRLSLRVSLPVMVEALKRDPVRWYKENKLELPKELAESRQPAGVGHEQ
jgi:nucleoside-diphosphate-sugar epimerase